MGGAESSRIVNKHCRGFREDGQGQLVLWLYLGERTLQARVVGMLFDREEGQLWVVLVVFVHIFLVHRLR